MAGEETRRLPLRVVLTGEHDLRKPDGGGGPRKVFGEVSTKTRRSLRTQLVHLQNFLAPAFADTPDLPGVAKIILKSDALAKSHRPSGLLNDNTCPIIGVRAFGELLVSVRPAGLDRLQQRIAGDDSKTGVANISTIDRVEPYTAIDALGVGLDQVKKIAADGEPLKFRLFSHHRAPLDHAVYLAFLRRIEQLKLQAPEVLSYGAGVTIYRIKGIKPSKVEELASFVGTRSLGGFPSYRPLRKSSLLVRALEPGDFPEPDQTVQYPLVGLVDTGTSPKDPVLSPWVIARHSYVPVGDEDFGHASFVAGLIVHSRLLNNDDPRFPQLSARIVDVAAIPKSGNLTENDLLAILGEVIPQHPNVRVWNLSLGTDEPCLDNGFSDFAAALDDLQDRYNVTFVLAAGNYQAPPFRGWPPEDLGEADRICSPADSVRGVSVASTAHVHRPNSRVKSEEPSPFSRRGPGPVFLPKPELSHYGGNCDKRGHCAQTGVMSLDGTGNLVEDIGTSFSTPLVSTVIANVGSILKQPASRNLLKALVVHSAMLGGTVLRSNELKYRGFGVPSDLAGVLTSESWAATLVFEPELVSGLELEKRDFPIPPCLRTTGGAVHGEFVMTLVYDPPLDSSFGAEYCRTNIEVSLGSYGVGKDGKWHHSRQIPPEPKDVNLMYERNLVEHGFKWSPVKVYRRHITRGVSSDEWRLRVTLTNRAEFSSQSPHRMALLVTIRDPDNKGPVYDQVVAEMNRAGWSSIDLQVKDRIRIGL